ncbi:hypothetical protein H4684_003691 [Desulfomicrobium macestii]|uniref:HEAT repeat domain-containing protein n=1 Tax=Desulfomicrobium macestii TaxID=90731 RepID=A0ABR9H943_9BACT|nr:hypothetical protein [Desulfomicrobium macestii]MBE1427007.1 hypothetical protein [Desulfomicrobium macestii]
MFKYIKLPLLLTDNSRPTTTRQTKFQSTNFEDDNFAPIIYKIFNDTNIKSSRSEISILCQYFGTKKLANSRSSEELKIETSNDFCSIHKKNIIDLILLQDFDYGFNSNADKYVQNIISTNKTDTALLLNSIFIENFDIKNIVTGILRIIAHLKYDDIYPVGQTMAIAALKHKDVEIRECGVRAYEIWGNQESIKALKSIKCTEKWLQDYIDQVINEITEEIQTNGSAC